LERIRRQSEMGVTCEWKAVDFRKELEKAGIFLPENVHFHFYIFFEIFHSVFPFALNSFLHFKVSSSSSSGSSHSGTPSSLVGLTQFKYTLKVWCKWEMRSICVFECFSFFPQSEQALPLAVLLRGRSSLSHIHTLILFIFFPQFIFIGIYIQLGRFRWICSDVSSSIDRFILCHVIQLLHGS